MFRSSRNKIVGLIMSILLLLLIGTLSVIYFTSYMEVYNQDQAMLERYISSALKATNGDGASRGREERQNNSKYNEHAFQVATFYAVSLADGGKILRVDNNGSAIYSEEELTELALSLIAKNKVQGTTGSLVYRVEAVDEYTLVAFMDNTIVTESITALFTYTLIFGGVIIVLLFFVSLYLAKRIVQPLEESYQKQKQFISDAGHELKTPVSVIRANAEMLSREIGDDPWLANIQFENDRMAALIKQLMELAKSEQVTPLMETLSFSRTVVGALLPLESVAFEQGLTLEYDAVAENVFVHGNAEQLGQLVSILLDNAISHCIAHGKITVALSVRQGKAHLSVSNEGQEIPKEQRERIFERFYRVDSARSGENGHYGLGLAIARAIVSAHHGDITVSCENGLVTFLVTIPL